MLEVSSEKANELLIKYCGHLAYIATVKEIQNNDTSLHNAVSALKSIRDNSSFHLQVLGERVAKASANSENPHLYLKTFKETFQLDETLIPEHKYTEQFNAFMTELKELPEVETVHFNPTHRGLSAYEGRMSTCNDHIINPSKAPSPLLDDLLPRKSVEANEANEEALNTCRLQ